MGKEYNVPELAKEFNTSPNTIYLRLERGMFGEIKKRRGCYIITNAVYNKMKEYEATKKGRNDIKKLARECSVTYSTIYSWFRKGVIKGIKREGSKYIITSEVKEEVVRYAKERQKVYVFQYRQLGVRFPKDIYKDLKRLAVEKETSMNTIIVEAVRIIINQENNE